MLCGLRAQTITPTELATDDIARSNQKILPK